jgi:hypothetical protein
MDIGEQTHPSPRPMNELGAAVQSRKGTTSEWGQSRLPPSPSSRPPPGPRRSAPPDPDEGVCRRRHLQETAAQGREAPPPPYLGGLCPPESPGGGEEVGAAMEALLAAAPRVPRGSGSGSGEAFRESFS